RRPSRRSPAGRGPLVRTWSRRTRITHECAGAEASGRRPTHRRGRQILRWSPRGTSLAHYAGTPMPPIQDLSRAYQELVRIGLALSQETDLTTLLDRVLTEVRWFTGAEAGTLYLLEGDVLQFAVVQNDRLSRRLGAEAMRRCLQAEPLTLKEPSLA